MELLTLFILCNKKKKLFLSTKSPHLTVACISNVINRKQVSDWFPIPGTKTFATSSLVRTLWTPKSRPSCACHFGRLALHEQGDRGEEGNQGDTGETGDPVTMVPHLKNLQTYRSDRYEHWLALSIKARRRASKRLGWTPSIYNRKVLFVCL